MSCRQVWIVPAALTLLLTACQQPGARTTIEKRFARREQNIQNTVAYLEQDEAKRPALLEASTDQVGVYFERDVRRTEANQGVIDDYFQRDFDRWGRRWPLYEREIARQLHGHPEKIEPTVAQALD